MEPGVDVTMHALTNPAVTTLVLVSRPDRASLAEADRSRAELAQMGVTNQSLLLNGIFRAQDRSDPAACALEERGKAALEAMPLELAKLNRHDIPLLAYAPLGVENLTVVFGGGAAGLLRLLVDGGRELLLVRALARLSRSGILGGLDLLVARLLKHVALHSSGDQIPTRSRGKSRARERRRAAPGRRGVVGSGS